MRHSPLSRPLQHMTLKGTLQQFSSRLFARCNPLCRPQQNWQLPYQPLPYQLAASGSYG